MCRKQWIVKVLKRHMIKVHDHQSPDAIFPPQFQFDYLQICTYHISQSISNKQGYGNVVWPQTALLCDTAKRDSEPFTKNYQRRIFFSSVNCRKHRRGSDQNYIMSIQMDSGLVWDVSMDMISCHENWLHKSSPRCRFLINAENTNNQIYHHH